MDAIAERSETFPPLPDITAPSRARFAAFAIGFGLGSSLLIQALLLPDAGWQAFALLASILLTLSSLTAMLVFRQIQLPLEAARAVIEEQALQLQTPVEPPLRQPVAESSMRSEPAPVASREARRSEAWEEAAYQRHCREMLIADRIEPVLLMRPDGRIDALNAAAAGLVSRPLPELHEQLLTGSFPLFDNTQPEPLQHPLSARLQDLFDGADADGQVFDALLERRGRTSVPVRLHCRPIVDPGQRVRLLMLMLQGAADGSARSFAQATIEPR